MRKPAWTWSLTRAQCALLGNHDYALRHRAGGVQPRGGGSAALTRARMVAALDGGEEAADAVCACAAPGGVPPCLVAPGRRRCAGSSWPACRSANSEGECLYVHASPLDPIFEYVFPDCLATRGNRSGSPRSSKAVPWVAFGGHTHFSMRHRRIAGSASTPSADRASWSCSAARSNLINIGSVGQPRDHDPRACYVPSTNARAPWNGAGFPTTSRPWRARSELMCGPGKLVRAAPMVGAVAAGADSRQPEPLQQHPDS